MKKVLRFFRNLFHPDKPTRVNLDYPLQWEMMTYQQFRDVCYILAQPGISRNEALLLCLCKLTGMRPANMNKYDPRKVKGKMAFVIEGKEHLIKASDIAAACHELAYIYDTIGLPPEPFPKVERMVYNLNFGQFYTADSMMMKAGSDKEHANFYLKEAAKAITNGAKRKLTDTDRVALTIWWNGVKLFLKGEYPYVFQDSDSISIGKTQAEILQDILSCMNGDRPQENENILKSNAHDVLFTLNKIYHDAVEKSHK